MMPHPERLTHVNNFSWAPEEWKLSPWLKLFNKHGSGLINVKVLFKRESCN